MSHHKHLCGIKIGSLGLLAVLFYLIDKSLAALDGYVAGEDYPAYNEVPQGLTFTCDDKLPGYYADPETQCQVWHWCVPTIGRNKLYSFICAAGTAFNQRTRVCDYFYNVDCQNSASYYGINEDLYKDEAGNYINGKKGKSYDNIHDRRRLTARLKRQQNVNRKSNYDRRYNKTMDKTDRPLTVLPHSSS